LKEKKKVSGKEAGIKEAEEVERRRRQKYEERGRRFCAGILEQSMRARTTE
jgi:hypothetical protein